MQTGKPDPAPSGAAGKFRAPLRALCAIFLAAVFYGCEKPEDPAAIAVVRKNLEAMEKLDAAGVVETMHPESPVRESLLDGLGQLAPYRLRYDTESVTWRGEKGGMAGVEVRQTIRPEDPGSGYRANRVRGRYLLKKQGEEWKIWNLEILDIVFLER